jgi:hypothetical protein
MDFQFGEQAYLGGLVSGLGAAAPLISSGTKELGTVLSPPISIHVASMAATLEGASGMSLGQLGKAGATIGSDVAAIVGAKSASDTVEAVSGLLNGVVMVVGKVAEGLGAASGVVNIIPIVGQIAGAALGVVASILRAAEALKLARDTCQQNCDQDAANRLTSFCNAWVGNWQRETIATSEERTPSDFFRPVAPCFFADFEVYSKARRITRGSPGLWFGNDLHALPMTPASLYVLLCGDELVKLTPHPDDPDADKAKKLIKRYAAIYEAARYATKPMPAPLSKQARAAMLRLVLGICAAAVKPTMGAPTSRSDSGRSLFPALQELVRANWAAGRISEPLLDNMSKSLRNFVATSLGDCMKFGEYEDCIGLRPSAEFARCSRVNIDLVTPFRDSINEFRNNLFAPAWYNASTGKWNLSAMAQAGAKATKVTKAVVVLDSTKLARLNGAVAVAIKRAEAGHGVGVGEVALLSVLGLGAGYGAWRGARHLLARHPSGR